MLLEEEMIPPLEQCKKRLRRVTLLKLTGPGWHRGTTWSCCRDCVCAEIEPVDRGRDAALTGDGHSSLRTREDFAFAAVEKATE